MQRCFSILKCFKVYYRMSLLPQNFNLCEIFFKAQICRAIPTGSSTDCSGHVFWLHAKVYSIWSRSFPWNRGWLSLWFSSGRSKCTDCVLWSTQSSWLLKRAGLHHSQVLIPRRLREGAALSEDAGCAWEQDLALFSPASVVKDQSEHGRFSGNQRPISWISRPRAREFYNYCL